jgi:lysine 2,3-aminomutase
MRGGSWRRALNYLAGAPAVRDVLISGGEPLVLSDERLDGMLRDLRRIRHVEIIRISTKIPAVLPQRITRDLARVLKRHHPLWLSVHFVHPDELTPETARACARLADAGIPMCSQTVLLKGVNDDPATMKRLMTGLLRLRVKPYYLHQCDLAAGASRFRTPVRRGVEILRSLHGHTSGYAAPLFMIDTPGGGGKVPVSPDFVAGRAGGDLLLENYRGETCRYPDFAQEQRRLAGARRSKLCALRLNGATNGIRTRQGHSTAESPTCPDMRQPR